MNFSFGTYYLIKNLGGGVVIKMFWLHFWGSRLSAIFICCQWCCCSQPGSPSAHTGTKGFYCNSLKQRGSQIHRCALITVGLSRFSQLTLLSVSSPSHGLQFHPTLMFTLFSHPEYLYSFWCNPFFASHYVLSTFSLKFPSTHLCAGLSASSNNLHISP